MNEPGRLPDRIRALFRRNRSESDPPSEEELPSVSWARWFDAAPAKRGRLHLSRAGVETYTSIVVGAREDDDGNLLLIVDPLLPTPERSDADETVTLDARLLHMDEGIEISTTFRAVLGRETEHDGYEAVELVEISDLDVDYREYLARVTEAHGVELNLLWEGMMETVYPMRIGAGRLLFNADLEGDIMPDGVEIPTASLCLEPGGKDYGLSIRLFRRPQPDFEAEITRIDSTVKEKLVRLIEEIWRTDSGLSRFASAPRQNVGYRTREHDALAEAFEHHIVYLGEDPGWTDFLKHFGIVREIAEMTPKKLVDVLLGGRCDLFVGDMAYCGVEAVPIEHTLQAYARTRKIPRFWIRTDEPETRQPDMLLEGAFEELSSEQLKQAGLTRRFEWAIAGDELGEGPVALLVSGDERLRYRLGFTLAEAGAHVIWTSTWRGLLPRLTSLAPVAILIDERTVKYDLDSILEPLMEVVPELKTKVVLLIEKASGHSIVHWKQMGIDDIVLIDPSLRETEKRVTMWLDWEGLT